MLELEHGFRVLDCNARLSSDAARSERGGPEKLEREFHQAGVVRAVVAPMGRGDDGPDGYLQENNAVVRLSVDRPFLAVARLAGPRDPRDTPAARLRNLAARAADHHASPADVEQFGYDDRFHGFLLARRATAFPPRRPSTPSRRPACRRWSAPAGASRRRPPPRPSSTGESGRSCSGSAGIPSTGR